MKVCVNGVLRLCVLLSVFPAADLARADAEENGVPLSNWKERSIKEIRAELDRKYTAGDLKAKEIVVEENGDYQMPTFDLEAAVVVLDTSGSMRSPETSLLDQVVVDRLLVFLLSIKNLSHIVLLDTDGRLMVEWSGEKGSINRRKTERVILGIAKLVARYVLHSESSWDLGIKKAVEVAENLTGKLETEIFLFGDEYTSNFWTRLGALKKISELPPINVVQAHANLINAGKRPKFDSAANFERYGKYLAELTGGSYYQFVGPHYSKSWETVVLVKMARIHPSETWIFNEEPIRIKNWNDTLKKEFEENREFLIPPPEDSIRVFEGIELSVSSEELHDGSVSCFLQRDLLDGSESTDYRARLKRQHIDSWEIVEWELVLEHEL